FADTDKDMGDKFKAWVANDVKEMVYWKQLITIVDDPKQLGATNPGWLEFAESQYASMKERMELKGSRVKAFDTGDLSMYNENIINNRLVIDSPFKSTDAIEYQGDKKYLL
ncbi:MAG TPA: hypothetical protein VHL77_00670, partial [Ferruginibacter sp.]|nr:hypothetical protein [Ferruginibacter sp.]